MLTQSPRLDWPFVTNWLMTSSTGLAPAPPKVPFDSKFKDQLALQPSIDQVCLQRLSWVL
jgi:hypothetical protein